MQSFPEVNARLEIKSNIECVSRRRPEVRTMLPLSRKTINDNFERRSRKRFRIGQDISYTCLSGTLTQGNGKVLDISSKGVRLTTEGPLTLGTRIELSVCWPVRLNDNCLLKLKVYGCVVRSESNTAAIRIECHEFRTRANPATPVSAER